MTGTYSYVACFAEDDWEFGHRKLAGLPVEDEASERAQFDEWLKKKGLGSTGDGPEAKFVGRNIEEDFEDELDREEVSLHFWLRVVIQLDVCIHMNNLLFVLHIFLVTCKNFSSLSDFYFPFLG